jgi:hypothetical protein
MLNKHSTSCNINISEIGPHSVFVFSYAFFKSIIFSILKLKLKNTIIDKTLTYASETWTLTKRDRKHLNVFERKVYRRILGPVYDSEKEYWRILVNDQLDALFFNVFISCLYMFRATSAHHQED